MILIFFNHDRGEHPRMKGGMAMPAVYQPKIPANDAQRITVYVSAATIDVFLEELRRNSNVLSITLRRHGQNWAAEVEFAVMDLALHFSAIASTIEAAARKTKTSQPPLPDKNDAPPF